MTTINRDGTHGKRTIGLYVVRSMANVTALARNAKYANKTKSPNVKPKETYPPRSPQAKNRSLLANRFCHRYAHAMLVIAGIVSAASIQYAAVTYSPRQD
jgi:hypothetical protein